MVHKVVFGYARVSTQDQNLDLQIDALNKYGVDKIFEEKISGTLRKRPVLDELLKTLRPGDTLAVYKLDRLGRTVKGLIELVEYFNKEEINFVSICENIDTTTSTGRFVFFILCAMAQMERDIISDRTKAGLEAARARGRFGGRPKAEDSVIKRAIKMYDSGEFSINEIEETANISRTTLYTYLRKKGKSFKQIHNFTDKEKK